MWTVYPTCPCELPVTLKNNNDWNKNIKINCIQHCIKIYIHHLYTGVLIWALHLHCNGLQMYIATEIIYK